MAEKVTINFGSFADNADNQDILIQGPVEIFARVDKPQDLEYLADIPNNRNIFVFVENVSDETRTDRKQSAYYMHSYEDNKWEEVLLGTHSHANKALLDQLGDVNVDSMEYNARKILTITKVDKDGGSYDDYSHSFKLDWKDYPTQLPDLPNDFRDRPVYLTYKDGKYVWEDKIIPAQTFQYTKVRVTEPGKSIEVPDLRYDEASKDTVLVFDSGDLVTIKENITKNENGNYVIEIAPDDDHTFDVGELITILVIKNGTEGFLNSIAEEYMTKQDAVKLLSTGTLSLNNYATKKDLEELANKDHGHGRQYASYDHNHDDRYAMFKHIHSDYVLESDVYAIISNCLAELLGQEDPGLSPEDILNKSFSQAITSIRSILETKADLTYLEEIKRNLETSIRNKELDLTDSYISIHNKEQNLKDYLLLLENRIASISGRASDIQLSAPIKVELKDKTIGKYKNGDVIDQGTTLQTLLQGMLREVIKPELTEPTLDLTYEIDNEGPEPGDIATTYFTVVYNKNDAGDIVVDEEGYPAYKIVAEDGTYTYERAYISYTEDGVEKRVLLDKDLTAQANILFTDKSDLNISCNIEYEQGEVHEDNYGNASYFIPAGTLSVEKTYKTERKMFLGYFNGTDIRTAKERPVETGRIRVEAKWYDKIKDFVVAIPYGQRLFVKSVFYLNQGCEILDLFERTIEPVPGANNYSPVLYEIYTYHMDMVPTDTLYFDVLIERSKA